MKIETKRFGIVEIDEENIIEFPYGILGFPDKKKYVILADRDNSPFFWMQSVEQADFALVVTNPLWFYPEYKVKVHRSELEDIKLQDLSKGEIWTFVTIRSNPFVVSVNLKGPILINKEIGLAKQLVINSDEYPIRYEIMRKESQGANA